MWWDRETRVLVNVLPVVNFETSEQYHIWHHETFHKHLQLAGGVPPQLQSNEPQPPEPHHPPPLQSPESHPQSTHVNPPNPFDSQQPYVPWYQQLDGADNNLFQQLFNWNPCITRVECCRPDTIPLPTPATDHPLSATPIFIQFPSPCCYVPRVNVNDFDANIQEKDEASLYLTSANRNKMDDSDIEDADEEEDYQDDNDEGQGGLTLHLFKGRSITLGLIRYDAVREDTAPAP
ncbi:hypothetical protein PIB30_061395 [Stylosanthes scabra]|uniref:Uncharacterized protein n=1 Tax=Stylosanthes scabra TaxID=79078 RepID=A0ABU6RLF0_9FABA|nr:hypothetical protein [Stylosanthes scabra]